MKQSKIVLSVLTSIALITACQPVTQLTPSGTLQSSLLTAQSSATTIKGKVEFPLTPKSPLSKKEGTSALPFFLWEKGSGDESIPSSSSPFTLKATITDITSLATVSLLYPHDHPTFPNTTIATGLSDSNGNFRINPNAGFAPIINNIYVLEALKRIGGSGNSVLTLRTFVKWNGTAWESITTPGVYINTKTTALAIISGFRKTDLPSSQTIGKMSVVNGITTISNIPSTLITADIINKVESLVTSVLLSNRDPMQYITYNLGLFSMLNPQKIPNPDYGKIFTVAGGIGDGGPATNASIFHPEGIAVDARRNIFIPDTINNMIKKVDALTGIITTVAGGGNLGDGNLATTASLDAPKAVAVDTNGNIYIADTGNNRIVKVNSSTGISNTVAGTGIGGYSGDGGKATSAKLDNPREIAVDTAGNIIIADFNNARVRKVNASTGIITTIADVANTGGVAVDSSGNIFIADYANKIIKKVDALTGIITTVAGNGNMASAGDGGQATSASFYYPSGVAVDYSGNIFIAETNNNNSRIRKVDSSTGIITTVTGGGNLGDGNPATSSILSEPSGIAVDARGNIFIADSRNNIIRKVDASTGIINRVAGRGTAVDGGDGGQATSAKLNNPRGLVVDTLGNIIIADSDNRRIRKVDVSTGIITTVAGGGYYPPAYPALNIGDGSQATNASLMPADVALDSSGNIFIADVEYGHNRIRKVDALTGIITTVAGNGYSVYVNGDDGGQATNVSLNYPMGIALDARGNIFIADSRNNRIRKVDSSTGIIATVAGNGTQGYIGDGGQATSASLFNPSGIAVDGNGNIFIADNGNSRIRKVNTSTGIITTVAGNGSYLYGGDGGQATSASLWAEGVALDSSGNIFIADLYNRRIRKVDASTGIITTVAGNNATGYSGEGVLATDASLSRPQALTVDANGNIFIIDAGDLYNTGIRKVVRN